MKTDKNKIPLVVKAPRGKFCCVTGGKEYKVIGTWGCEWDCRLGHRFKIIADDGDEAFGLEFDCSLINNKNWIITKYKETSKPQIIQNHSKYEVRISGFTTKKAAKEYIKEHNIKQ